MSSSSSVVRWAVLGAGALAVAAAGWEWYKKSQPRVRDARPSNEKTSASASASASASSSSTKISKDSIPPCRPLHWVLKVGDLRASVEFYNSVLGLAVMRHEEFKEGCEASCNGPYSGWWSKTMMSFPATGENAFSLELTYNYGIQSYELGNDLLGLHVRVPGALDRARAKGYDIERQGERGVHRVKTPDGIWVYLHPAADSSAAPSDPFLYVSLNSVDIQRGADFYKKVLGMREFSSSEGRVLLGYSDAETKVQLVALPPGVPLNHGKAQGRLALGSQSFPPGSRSEVYNAFNRATAFGTEVLHTPVTLNTDGKASVTVTILLDADGDQICVVDDAEFRQLCIRKPGDDAIDWAWREKSIKIQLQFQESFNNPEHEEDEEGQ